MAMTEMYESQDWLNWVKYTLAGKNTQICFLIVHLAVCLESNFEDIMVKHEIFHENPECLSAEWL